MQKHFKQNQIWNLKSVSANQHPKIDFNFESQSFNNVIGGISNSNFNLKTLNKESRNRMFEKNYFNKEIMTYLLRIST